MPVTSLGVQELSRLREQLQADVEHLLDSNGALGRAAARSEAAGKAVATLAVSKPGLYQGLSANKADMFSVTHPVSITQALGC